MAVAGGNRGWSYSTSERMSAGGRWSELTRLYSVHTQVRETALRTVSSWRTLQELLRAHVGLEPKGLDVLEVGPGQQLRLSRCLSLYNQVTGIDLDVISDDDDLLAYVRMLRHNTGLRVLKTLARKLLGVDRRLRRELATALGVRDFAPLPVLRMDASRMTFPSARFDLAVSYSVFEHIQDPESALSEVVRVLRPGGGAFVSVHLYTSHSGSHDPRVMFEPLPRPPFWPHLRARHMATVQPSAYVNRLTLREWEEMFARRMPGVHLVQERQSSLQEPLQHLREGGELNGWTDADLLTVNLIGIWRKPTSPQSQLEALSPPAEVRWVP